MPLIQPSNDTNITILDDEGTVILDIDPTSALFWGRHVMLKSGFEVHLLAGDFVSFEEGDVLHYREDGVLRFKEADGEYTDEEETGQSGRKRKRMERGISWSAGGDEDTNGNSGSQAESSSALDSENMSSVDDGSERSGFTSGDSSCGPPNAKKVKLGVEDGRGRATDTETETEAVQDVQQDSVGRCDDMIDDAPMEEIDM